MTTRLPSVLSAADLPEAELWAARLDGELFRLGACFTPIDEIEAPVHRASVVHSGLAGRLIAEQMSAAWIWGAFEPAPRRRQLCVDLHWRIGHELPPSVWVREVVIDRSEIDTIGGFRVTTPLRTIIDIARFSEDFDPATSQCVASLMRMFDITLLSCAAELNNRRNLPGKRRAHARLSLCSDGSADPAASRC